MVSGQDNTGHERHIGLTYLLDLAVPFLVGLILSALRESYLKAVEGSFRSIYATELNILSASSTVFILLAVFSFALFYVMGRFLRSKQGFLPLAFLSGTAAYAGCLLGVIAVSGLRYLGIPLITQTENTVLTLISVIPLACMAAVGCVGGYMTGIAHLQSR